MSYTSGPWKAAQDPTDRWYQWRVWMDNDEPHHLIANILPNPHPESAANAHLIAAAPTLYEAATYLLAHEDASPDDNLDQDTYSEAWEFLKETVEKAEGKQ